MKLYDREKVFDILRINWVQTTKIDKVFALCKELTKYDIRQIGLCMEDM